MVTSEIPIEMNIAKNSKANDKQNTISGVPRKNTVTLLTREPG